MKVLVTGAAGMLGRDVMLAAGNAGHDVVGFGRMSSRGRTFPLKELRSRD